MAQINSALSDVLENRYASEHVGGAFDAKNLSQPKTIEQALNSATFGRKSDESLMLEGQDTRRYIKRDNIIPEIKPQLSLVPRGVNGISAKSMIPTSRKLRPSRFVGVAPGQYKREKVLPPGIIPQPILRPATSPKPAIVPGQTFGFIARRVDIMGDGKPGIPIPRSFIPTPPKPFGPLIDLPVPIYWDTDPDIWDMTKFIGQTYWDH